LGESLTACLFDWPDLIAEMHKMFHRPDPDFERVLLDESPHPTEDVLRDMKHEKATWSVELLDQGRAKLADGVYREAFSLLTTARRYLWDAMRPSQRWYLNAPFQVASNRALAAERLGMWNVCRQDTRCTLVMQPDHWKSFQRLPLIAEAFEALALRAELAEMVAEIDRRKPMSARQWRKYASVGIAMISVSAIMASRMGQLSDAKREELVRLGIEDMYTPVSSRSDVMEMLPWVDESRLEIS
jgi:hypothetical protein